MPIPTVNRNQGAICQARKQILAAEQNADKKALQLRERLVAAYRSYLDAKLAVEAFNSDIRPTAEKTLKLVSEGYRVGEVGFLELLTAQRTFFRTNLANIEQLREMWRQRINIEGMLLSGSLDQQ